MIVRKTLSLVAIFRFAGQHLVWLVPWMMLVTALYYFTRWKALTIPWLPLSLIGTAVAFYVGFKNNQSYARLWEARQIWGAMINNSRKLGSLVRHYRSEGGLQAPAGQELRTEIIRRHIAYLYQLREQLLRPTRWEHVSLRWIFGRFNRLRRDHLFETFREELDDVVSRNYLSDADRAAIAGKNNAAVHLLDLQTESVQRLFGMQAITWAQQLNLQDVVSSFYDEQGKAERIKNFPFPRNYASFSFVFVCIFVFLLPFGIVAEFAKLGDAMIWLSVPCGVVIGWIYVAMELVGDYSENPFEGLQNDIPMLSICRTIEIDLLQMSGAATVPAPIAAKDGVLL